MKRKIGIVLAVIFIVTTMATIFAGCKDKKLDNETSHLILSSGELDEVFNPFFASSGNDSTINSYTQMGLISTSKDGEPLVGENEPTIALDYTDITTGSKSLQAHDKDFSNYYTTYKFLMKNGLKFSDGSPITAKDVLFNFYVYLDPVYTGSTTMYSVDIQGMKAYRAQSLNVNEWDNSEAFFERLGQERINNIISWCDDGNSDDTISTEEQIKDDIEIIKDLFKKELRADWVKAASEIDAIREEYPVITERWQVFLMLEGLIQIKYEQATDEKYIDFAGYDTNPPPSVNQDAMIDLVFNDVLGRKQEQYDETLKQGVISLLQAGWNTGSTAKSHFTNVAKEDHFDAIKEANDGGLIVETIEGLKTYKLQAGEDFNGKTYNEEHEIIEIKINGVDPKAIWNFAVDIAPMKHYTTKALYDASMKYYTEGAGYVDKSFGVELGSSEFMDVVRDLMIPIGAGPYKASTVNEFFKNNIVSMERNEHFVLGAAKIKYLDFKVIATNSTFDAVQKGEVHYASPNAKPETRTAANDDPKLGYELLDNMGYGYIGINARYVKDLKVRQAFMHAMNTELVLNYYHGGMATVIHRSMSTNSWAFPEGKTSAYPYDDDGSTSEDLIWEAGYSKRGGVFGKLNSKGVWEELKFTFTLAGDTNDHPAYSTFAKAAEILNKIGCKITVINDPNALSKLASGDLAVWAAAWGSTIDPDMYQVYHKDSQATSVLNWGYREILNSTENDENSTTQKRIINELSDLIDMGRQSLDNKKGGERADIYERALDKLMELAVELPTYQRKNLFVFRADILDKDTFNKDKSAFTGPLSKIWNVEFKK